MSIGLDLSKEKTKLIEFRRWARINAEKKDKKPDTFDFLGLTNFCDRTGRGKFKVGRKTKRKKLNTSLKEMKGWLNSVRNTVKIRECWKVLAAKLRRYYEYY